MLRKISRIVTFSTPLIRRNLQLFSGITDTGVVNKYIVTRTEEDKYSIYVDSSLTVQQLKLKLQELFPNRKIGISTNIQHMMSVGTLVDEKVEKQIMQKLKDVTVMEALVLNKLIVYQKNEKNQMQLIYGIEVSEYNMTNRMNIPEFIEQGIAELNAEWSINKMTIGNALNFGNIRKFQQGSLTSQQGQQLQTQLSKQQQIAMKQSMTQLIKIKKFNTNLGPYLPRTNTLMKRILTLMSTNWIFLFYLTYAKYGWDVGEPVSYLTGLGVDLTAMMGLFESNQALISQKQKDKHLIQSVINLRANQNMAKWRIAYLNRKISA